jgi:hypothetical protein
MNKTIFIYIIWISEDGVAQPVQGLGYGLDERSSIPGRATASAQALGPTKLPIQRVPQTLSPGVKGPEREADHSPPSSAEVKNPWSYTSALQYVFMAWYLIKHRDNFTFTLNICNKEECNSPRLTLEILLLWWHRLCTFASLASLTHILIT